MLFTNPKQFLDAERPYDPLKEIGCNEMKELSAARATAPSPYLEQIVTSRLGIWLWLSVGSALMWLAYPPVGWWPLALVGMAIQFFVAKHAPAGRRFLYVPVYVTSFIFWMLLIEGVRRPHWASNFGWVLLAAYTAIYPTLLFWFVRSGTTRLRLPLWLVAPISVVGLELLRGYVITGFSIGLLGHAVYQLPLAVQVADLGGAYLVSFWLAIVAAALTNGLELCLPASGTRLDWQRTCAAPLLAILTTAAVIGYGYAKLPPSSKSQQSQQSQQSQNETIRIALVQGSYLSDLTFDKERRTKTFNECLVLSKKAMREHPDTELIVWPESLFLWLAYDIVIIDDDPSQSVVTRELSRKRGEVKRFQEMAAYAAAEVHQLAQPSASLLVGVESIGVHVEGDDYVRYNTALLIDPQGKPVERYFKMHRVIAGEYVPFGDTFPWLYEIVPINTGIHAGEDIVPMQVGKFRFAPSICFETVVPHLIRQQINELEADGESVDAIVNLSNDGWFHLSAVLDLHFACSVFRAVENRKPVLIAANTGITGGIDPYGRVINSVPRGEPTYASVLISKQDESPTLYRRFGDTFAFVCFFGMLVMLLADRFGGWFVRVRN